MTVGLDAHAARISVTPEDVAVSSTLANLLPETGLDVELWEIGGRETSHREAPRGRHVDGLLLCYDLTDRTSFHRAAQVLLSFKADRHLAVIRAESIIKDHTTPPQLTVVLCGLKADCGPPAMTQDEVEMFVREQSVASFVMTSAFSGAGVADAFHALVAAVMQAEQQLVGQTWPPLAAPLAAEAWSLQCPERPDSPGPMTSPRGFRPLEPVRPTSQASTRLPIKSILDSAPLERRLEVFDQNWQPCGTRTLERCLERGLRHRAVHIWVYVPVTGALLLRRYANDAPKHPGRWGPTVHGEVLCYGAEGDGHASEMSVQAAARCLAEQIGVSANDVQELEQLFSCSACEGCLHGTSNELLDVYVAALKGEGLPPLSLQKGEQVDWVFFADVFSEEAKQAGTIFRAEEDYVRAILRPLRARVVRNDVLNAWGPEAGLALRADEARGLPQAGKPGALRSDGRPQLARLLNTYR